MHRFMDHLDDLAGLDMVQSRRRRESAVSPTLTAWVLALWRWRRTSRPGPSTSR